MENLSRRGVPVEVVCLICRTYNETVTHVLWTCVIANGVWTSWTKRKKKKKCSIVDCNSYMIYKIIKHHV